MCFYVPLFCGFFVFEAVLFCPSVLWLFSFLFEAVGEARYAITLSLLIYGYEVSGFECIYERADVSL